jgi:hypothetical protein
MSNTSKNLKKQAILVYKLAWTKNCEFVVYFAPRSSKTSSLIGQPVPHMRLFTCFTSMRRETRSEKQRQYGEKNAKR